MGLIFLDTEFSALPNNDPLTGYLPKPSLISIGLVTEAGDSFYAESTDFKVRFCSDFVKQTVLPLLTGPRLTPDDLRIALNNFLSAQPDGSQIACDYYFDFELLVRAVGALPPNIQKDYLDMAKIGDRETAVAAMEVYFASGKVRHHALHDAEALRMGWLATQGDV